MVVGNVLSKSLLEIWNDEPILFMRQKMLDRDIEDICPDWCPWLLDQRFQNINLAKTFFSPIYRKNRELTSAEIVNGHIKINSFPQYIQILPTLRCNLRCSMCYQDHNAAGNIPFSAYDLDKFLPFLGSLRAVGGEPLMSTHFKQFVSDFNPDQYPDLRLGMITNGLLLNPSFIRLLPGRFEWIDISIDGATQATYERIRVGASWPTLMQNIREITNCPSRDYRITVIFTIMKDNFHELPLMGNLVQELGIQLSVHPVRGRSHGQQIETLEDVELVLTNLKFLQLNTSLVVKHIEGTIKFYEKLRKLIIDSKFDVEGKLTETIRSLVSVQQQPFRRDVKGIRYGDRKEKF